MLVLFCLWVTWALPRGCGRCKAKGRCVTRTVAPSGIYWALEDRHSSFSSVPLLWLSPCLGTGGISSSSSPCSIPPDPTEACVLSVLSPNLQAMCPSAPPGELENCLCTLLNGYFITGKKWTQVKEAASCLNSTHWCTCVFSHGW